MASTNVTMQQAFVLRPEMVERLCEKLQRAVGSVEIKAHCADGVEREFSDMEKLIRYDNLRARQIRSLHLRARSEDWKGWAVISISSVQSETTYLYITALEEVVITLRQELISLLGEIRPWYSRVTTLDFVSLLFLALGASWITIMLGLGLGLIPSELSSPAGSDGADLSIPIGFTIAVIAIAIGWLLNLLRDKLFPRGTFAIGEGMTRYETLEKIRWAVVIGIGVSALGSLIANALV